MQKKDLLYEGKAKRVFTTPDPCLYVMEFKDDTSAFDGVKLASIPGKGRLNNAITAHFFSFLGNEGVPNHFVDTISEREMLVRAVKIIPVEVIVRNVVAGSLAKRLGLKEGDPLQKTVLELNLKDDSLHDPMINASHIFALGLANQDELTAMEKIAVKANRLLKDYLHQKGILLVDCKFEFGRCNGEVILADEISPDTCRFWDISSSKKLDKDRFRRDLGGLIDAYQEVLMRLEGEKDEVES